MSTNLRSDRLMETFFSSIIPLRAAYLKTLQLLRVAAAEGRCYLADCAEGAR